MIPKRKNQLMFRWSLFSAGLIALFWLIWSAFGEVPSVDKIQWIRSAFTGGVFSNPNTYIDLSISVSRWFDILLGPIYSVLIVNLVYRIENKKLVYWIKNKKEEQNYDGLMFGLMYGFIFSPLLGLTFGLVLGLIAGLGISLQLSFKFDFQSGLVASLIAGLGIGLVYGLIFGLIASLVAGLGVSLVYLIRKGAKSFFLYLKSWFTAKQ